MREHATEGPRERPGSARKASPAATRQQHVLALQRAAGNRATRRLLARKGFDEFLAAHKGESKGLDSILTKSDLHKFFTDQGQDKEWIAARLAPISDKWRGRFLAYGGRWEYVGAIGSEYDPREMDDILRTLREAESGRLKQGVLDYAGENKRDPKYRWCTEAFVGKHVFRTGTHKSAMKQGKSRMAGQANIAANSVIDPGDMPKFEEEIAARQEEFARAFGTAVTQSAAAGTVNRGINFNTNAKFEVMTYEAGEADAHAQRGHVHFSVVRIDDRYLVNHFGGVT